MVIQGHPGYHQQEEQSAQYSMMSLIVIARVRGREYLLILARSYLSDNCGVAFAPRKRSIP